MLAVSNLCAVRDDRVLFEQLDFALNTGEIMQVVGANGTGKTTLLNFKSISTKKSHTNANNGRT